MSLPRDSVAPCVSSGSNGVSCVFSSGSDGAYSVFSSESDGTSSVSSSGSGGAFSVSSSGSDGAFRVSTSESEGIPCVSSGSNGASCVSFSRSDGASRVFSSRSDDTSHVSSEGSGGASCVFSSGSGGTSCVSCFVLVMPAAAPAPAPVLQAAEPLFFRLIHLHPASRRGPHHQHCCCRSCQARQSTAPPTVLLSLARVPRRPPTGPSSRFPLPEPFSSLSPRSVCAHTVYLHHIMRFRRHCRRRTSPQAPSLICAGPPLVRRLYSHCLSRF